MFLYTYDGTAIHEILNEKTQTQSLSSESNR